MNFVIQIIIAIISIYLAEVLAPKPPRPKPASIEDFEFPTVDDGTPMTVVFGDVWIKDWTVLGVGNYRNEPIIVVQSGMFTDQKLTAGYKYSMGLHMGLCRSMDDLVEIRVGDITAWTGTITPDITEINLNQPELFGGDKGEGGIVGLLKIQRGEDAQPALAELELMVAGPVPAYRGVITFFYDGLVCSNSPYPKAWSFRVRRTLQGWDGSVFYPDKAVISLASGTIKAMNPVHILYELQTNTDWGRGFAPGQLDLVSYMAVADKLYAEGFGLCLAWRRQDQISEFMGIILSHINAAHFIDRTTGLWKLVLIRDDYDVNTLPVFTNSTGLLSIQEDNNSAQDNAINQVLVTYVDPVSNENRLIKCENIAAIQQNGVISQSTTYAGIPTANLAGRLAARDMKVANSGLKRFKLVLDRRAYLIQPASVFKISSPEHGLNNIVLRAVRVDHDTFTDGKITVTAMQDIYGLPATSFISAQPPLWQPPSLIALPVTVQKLYEVPYTELLREFTATQLAGMTEKGFMGVLAQRPTSMHLNFDILTKRPGIDYFENTGAAEFCFIYTLSNAVAQTAALTVITLSEPISPSITLGARAFIDNEIVRIDVIDRTANTITIARGCIDTLPDVHAAGAKLYIYSNIASVPAKPYVAGSNIKVKLLTRTSSQLLPEGSASEINFNFDSRLARPYPPALLKLNNISYPGQYLQAPLSTLGWAGRNRISQDINIVDQLAASVANESGVTFTVLIFKQLVTGGTFTLATALTGLNVTTALADNGLAIIPGVTDFYSTTTALGRLTAIAAPNKATRTTQRLVLQRPQVGVTYGLTLDPNQHGAAGFDSKHVEEEFLSSDTCLTFLNRLKDKITNTLSSGDKTALRYGLFHSLNGGWRVEGSSGRVLEISHSVPGQGAGNIINFVLYSSTGDVVYRHQFSSAVLGDFYFDAATERCWLWLEYSGALDLNNAVATNNPHLRTFTFDDVQTTGIAFTRAASSQALFITKSNFCFRDGLLWAAIPSGASYNKAPITLSKLNVTTLAVTATSSYSNAVVSSTSPASDTLFSDGKVILTDTDMFYANDVYLKATDMSQYLYGGIARFNRSSGAYVSHADHQVKALGADQLAFPVTGSVGYIAHPGCWIETDGTVTVSMGNPTSVISPGYLQATCYDYATGLANRLIKLDLKHTDCATFAVDKQPDPKFGLSNYHNVTGKYQFITVSYRAVYPAAWWGYGFWGASAIVNTVTWAQLNYADALLVKTAVVSAAPDMNIAGFPAAAWLDIEFDVVGAYQFTTTSTARVGSGPGDAILFSDVSDACALRVMLWSVNSAGVQSWQQHTVETELYGFGVNFGNHFGGIA